MPKIGRAFGGQAMIGLASPLESIETIAPLQGPEGRDLAEAAIHAVRRFCTGAPASRYLPSGHFDQVRRVLGEYLTTHICSLPEEGAPWTFGALWHDPGDSPIEFSVIMGDKVIYLVSGAYEIPESIEYHPGPPRRSFEVPIQYQFEGRGEPLPYELDEE